MRKNINKNKQGFSLIETLIAVTILMIAIVGPLTLVQAGLFSSIHQRNQTTAIYLAQEAIEYIKNLRDNNSYAQYVTPPGVNWLTSPNAGFLTDVCSIACYVDPHQKLPGGVFVQTVPDLNNLLPLYQNTNGNNIDGSPNFTYYSYDTSNGTVTPYTRIVRITQINGDEVTVTVTINWKDNALARTYSVGENIYNYEQP